MKKPNTSTEQYREWLIRAAERARKPGARPKWFKKTMLNDIEVIGFEQPGPISVCLMAQSPHTSSIYAQAVRDTNLKLYWVIRPGISRGKKFQYTYTGDVVVAYGQNPYKVISKKRAKEIIEAVILVDRKGDEVVG